MDQEIVIAVLDEIVRTVILLCDSTFEKKSTLNLNGEEETEKEEKQKKQKQVAEQELEQEQEIKTNEEETISSTDIDSNLKEDVNKENQLIVEDNDESSEGTTREIVDSNLLSDSREFSSKTTNYLSNSKSEHRLIDQNLVTKARESKSDLESNVNNLEVENRISNYNPVAETNFGGSVSLSVAQNDKQTFPINELTRSPRIYGRKVRQTEDLAIPSTSTGIVPSVIVLHDFSNDSSSSAYSTGEMRRRTVENNFAFLPDSDLSDEEIGEQNLASQNRAYESFEAIEITHEETEIIPVEEYDSIKYNHYIWSSMGFMKVAQVICCITIYFSIGLCRFHSKQIQIFSIFGACISIFLLVVYSYRIQIDHWRDYTIRLLLSEYVYLVIYTTCDTVFAIIKFGYDEEANYRERMAVMILMISTGVAASTYCYDAILCYSLIEEASRNNPDEKKLLLSYLPTCSKSSRAEICDIFHTCIL